MKIGRVLGIFALCVGWLGNSTLARVNYWTNSVSGYWEEPYWSLGILPGTNQNIVFDNDGWKALGLGPNTVQNFPDSLNVGTITISSPSNSFNSLLLNYMGFEKPLTAETITINSNAALTALSSMLVVTNTGSTDYRLEVGGAVNQGESAIVNADFLSLGNVGPGVYNLTNGSLIVNTGYVGGNFDGLIRQYGGTSSVGTLRVLGSELRFSPWHPPLPGQGEYDLYDGVLTGGVELYFGGRLKQSGGTFNGTLRFDGIYELQGGFFTNSNMDIPAAWGERGEVVQTGGTNQLINLTLSVEGGDPYSGGYAGGEYVLSNGVLNVTTIRGGLGTLWQAGGVLTNQGLLSLGSGVVTVGASADVRSGHGQLDAGWMGTGSLDLYGASFEQNGGTNQVSGAATIESQFWGDGIGTTHGRYTLSNGLFSVSSLVISDGGALAQSGGTLMTRNLSLIRPAGWGYDPAGPTFCDLSGGQLVVSNIQIRGLSVMHHKGGGLLHQGLLTWAGGLWDEHTSFQQFGPLQLSFTNSYADGSNSTLSLPTNGCLIRFADSRAVSWSTNAFLTVSNWNGSTNGGGLHRVIFGTNSFALTAAQLSQIVFIQPNNLSGTFPARLFATGEVVPDTGRPAPPVLGAPIPQSNGAMKLVVSGDLGRVYGVAVSTDLLHWYAWSNQVGQGGPTTFLDSEATNYPRRFYRAFVQP